MKPFRLLVLVTCGFFAAALSTAAEEKKAGPPKPGPEVKKLAYFAGDWTTEGEIKANPMMPGGKFTETSKCSWFSGGFHLVCHSKGTGPMGETHGIGILGYNAEDKAYTFSGIDNSGYAGHGNGSTDGKSWVYSSEDKMGGKTIYGRYTMTDLAPDSYTFKWEMSEDNKTWNAVMEGKATRAAKSPAKK